jgi:hypothetical protein
MNLSFIICKLEKRRRGRNGRGGGILRKYTGLLYKLNKKTDLKNLTLN